MKSIKMKVVASGYYHDVHITNEGLIFVDNILFLMRLFLLDCSSRYQVVSTCPGEIGSILYTGSKSEVLAFLHGAISVNIRLNIEYNGG